MENLRTRNTETESKQDGLAAIIEAAPEIVPDLTLYVLGYKEGLLSARKRNADAQ